MGRVERWITTLQLTMRWWREANHFWLPWRRSPTNLIEWKSGRIKRGSEWLVTIPYTMLSHSTTVGRKISASDSWMIRKFRRKLKMNY